MIMNLMKCLDKAIYAKNNKKNDPKAFISFYSEEMYQDIVRKNRLKVVCKVRWIMENLLYISSQR